MLSPPTAPPSLLDALHSALHEVQAARGTAALKFSQLIRGICSGQCSPNCPPPRRHASRKVVAGHRASVIRTPPSGATTASASATALLLPVPTITRAVATPRFLQAGAQKGSRPAPERGSRSRKVRVHLQIADAAPHTSDPADLPVSTPHHEPLWPLLTPPRRDPPTACAHLRCTPTDQLQIT